MAKKNAGDDNKGVTAKYFDYLDEHGAELEERLETPGLVDDIKHYRRFGSERSKDAGRGCRDIIESIIRSYLGEDDQGIKLSELIEDLGEDDIVPRGIYCQLNEIRRKGNVASHSYGKVFSDCDAKSCLECLDEFLRFLIKELRIDEDIADKVPRGTDAIFIVHDEEVIEKAKIAADLSGDKAIVSEATAKVEKAKAFEQKVDEGMQALVGILDDLDAFDEEPGKSEDESTAKEKLLSKAQEVTERLEQTAVALVDQQDGIMERADEIISEHDFIAKLLGGDNSATEEQLRVMAFPKTAGATTNVLRISGAAGTGKTLCLLAKLIMDIKEEDQQNLFETPEKKALFVCFNTNLATYTKDLLKKFPEECKNIEVVNFDRFVNQLVKHRSDPDYVQYAICANDVRYPQGYKVYYSNERDGFRHVKEAMDDVAKKYPKRANSYLLDSSREDNVRWVVDELAWLDARYENANDAKTIYPSVARVGRGKAHNPSAEYRKIILDIWRKYDEILEQEKLYTIDQATKRLMRSNSLPKYDAIAIDEAQDFAIQSIRLLLNMRRDDKSRLYISADENQKIFQRDFTWKELDSSVVSYTVMLSKNERNSESIQAFADRLLGVECEHDKAARFVHVEMRDKDQVVSLISRLVEKLPERTVALIGRENPWEKLLEKAGIELRAVNEGILEPGVYRVGPYVNKGLEFDTVIVDLGKDYSAECTEEEKRLRYVHFTRARQRLYVRYDVVVPRLISEYYPDFV